MTRKKLYPALFICLLASCTPAASAPTSTFTPPVERSITMAATATLEPTLEPTPVSTFDCTIAFDTDRDGNREIYSIAPDGSQLTNLSNNPADDLRPTWSPDGSQIAFVSNRPNDFGVGQVIYVMDADGNNLRALPVTGDSDFPNWSHDGTRITYVSSDDVFVINADGSGEPINLTNSPDQIDSRPAWSPDDSHIAWISGDHDTGNIFVMNTDGSNKRKVTSNGQIGEFNWTVDGRILTRTWGWDNTEEICHNCVLDWENNVVVDAGGKGEIMRYVPFWDADGNRVEIIGIDLNPGNFEIYLVSGIYPDIFLNLTDHPSTDSNPAWPANCGPADKTLPDIPEERQVEIAPIIWEEPQVQPSPTTTEDPPDFEQTPTPIILGYAGDRPEHEQRKVDFQKACDELGVACLVGDIPELLASQVTAIVYNTDNNEVQGLQDEIALARENGIPVFLLDSEAEIAGTYSVSINHQILASNSISALIEQTKKHGEILYYNSKPGNGYDRSLEEMLTIYPGISVAIQRDSSYDFSLMREEVFDQVKNNPNLVVIWTTERISEALQSVVDAGLPPKDWPRALCEPTKAGLTYWEMIIQENPHFYCYAISNPPGIAYDAAYAAYYLSSGLEIIEEALCGAYGRTLEIEPLEVRPENFAEALESVSGEDDDYILDAFLSPEEIKNNWFRE